MFCFFWKVIFLLFTLNLDELFDDNDKKVMHQLFDMYNSKNKIQNKIFYYKIIFVLVLVQYPYLHFHLSNQNIFLNPLLNIQILNKDEHLWE
jgi:hypothetical protein